MPKLAGQIVILGLILVSVAGCAPWARGQDYTLVVFRNGQAVPCTTLHSIPQYPNTMICLSQGQTGTITTLSGGFINRRDISRFIAMRANGTEASYEPRILPISSDEQRTIDKVIQLCGHLKTGIRVVLESPKPPAAMSSAELTEAQEYYACANSVFNPAPQQPPGEHAPK